MPQQFSPSRSARVPLLLLFVFILIWIWLAIDPWYRQDWLLENVLVFIGVPVLVWGYTRLPFSDSAYTLLFIFLVLHEVGAHYTYSEVPYDRWFETAFGRSLNAMLGWERNHFDRLVHFLYGLLLTPAIMELLDAVAQPRGVWRWLLPVSFVMAHSQLFELIEWLAALVFGGDLGTAYLGTQGDVWDAQKDMALATLGAAITAAALLGRRRMRGAPGPIAASENIRQR